MNLLRAFIALEIPPKVQEDLYRATSNLRRGTGSLIRWVPAENMHLTLKFLGDISPTNVEFLTQMIRTEAEAYHCFEIRLTGLGIFPNSKRPRVIYIGIQAPAELESLQHAVESGTRRLGYESEDRSFSPHLTIGRVKNALRISAADQQKIQRALEETKIDSLGTARVNSVHLYKSDLQSTGSVYTKLYSAQLKN
jgi:RNA 2',3'-cyclic 3'-phosphodiesterase